MTRDFEMAKAYKLSRFRFFFLDPGVVSAAEAWTPVCVPVSGVQLEIKRQRVVRIILPYTMRWLGLAAKLQEIDSKWCPVLRSLGFDIRVQVSFRRGGQSLASLVNICVEPDLHVYRQVRAHYGR